MMIKAAGGPGAISPLDFNDRPQKRLSTTSWIAIGVVIAAHVGVGAVLYYQQFDVTVPPPLPDKGIEVIMHAPRPPEPLQPVKRVETPPPPNLPLNRAPAPTMPTETLVAVPGDAPTDSRTISIATPAPAPVENAVPTPTPAPEPRARTITNPSWARQPTSEQMMRAYPDRALDRGISGVVTMNCLVQPSGAVTDCGVVDQSVSGQGFDRAALSLSRYFRVNPRTVDGAAEGTRVTFNLRFVPPAD